MVGVKLSGSQGSLAHHPLSCCAASGTRCRRAIPEELGSRIADSLLDMFATSCAQIKGGAVAEAAVIGARRVQIKRYIEANLRNPELSVRSVAAAFGISPRYLHIMFSPRCGDGIGLCPAPPARRVWPPARRCPVAPAHHHRNRFRMGLQQRHPLRARLPQPLRHQPRATTATAASDPMRKKPTGRRGSSRPDRQASCAHMKSLTGRRVCRA